MSSNFCGVRMCVDPGEGGAEKTVSVGPQSPTFFSCPSPAPDLAMPPTLHPGDLGEGTHGSREGTELRCLRVRVDGWRGHVTRGLGDTLRGLWVNIQSSGSGKVPGCTKG